MSRYKFPYETTVGVSFFHGSTEAFTPYRHGPSRETWRFLNEPLGGEGGEKFALRGSLYHEHPKP